MKYFLLSVIAGRRAYGLEQKCIDYEFTFNHEGQERGCKWLKNLFEQERQGICQDEAVRNGCRSSCGLCCEDSLDFTLDGPSGGIKDCAWIETDGRDSGQEWCELWSMSGELVRDYCLKTCSTCLPYVHKVDQSAAPNEPIGESVHAENIPIFRIPWYSICVLIGGVVLVLAAFITYKYIAFDRPTKLREGQNYQQNEHISEAKCVIGVTRKDNEQERYIDRYKIKDHDFSSDDVSSLGQELSEDSKSRPLRGVTVGLNPRCDRIRRKDSVPSYVGDPKPIKQGIRQIPSEDDTKSTMSFFSFVLHPWAWIIEMRDIGYCK